LEPSKPTAASSGFWPAAVLVVLVLGIGLFQHDVAADTDAPTDQAIRVSEVCLDCHEGYDTSLALNPHHLDPDALDGPDARVTCTNCHTGKPEHYEDDPEANPMTKPSDLGVSEEGAVCSQCHLTDHQQNMMEDNAHAHADVNCSGCHKIHDTHDVGLLQKPQYELCLGCHSEVRGAFAQPFRHPVSDGVMVCSECHLTLDKVRTELSKNGTNVICAPCHNEFVGPYPFEHQATLDYSAQEGGCLSCHDPHGSAYTRMLKQPYEPPNFQLCTQCHSIPPGHNQNSHHGSQWAGIACNECHSDIHGSYTSRKLLSESLEAEGCFSAGCHPPGR